MQRHQGFRPRPGNIGDYVAIVRLEVACQLGLQWVKPSKMRRFNGSQIATHPYPSQLLPATTDVCRSLGSNLLRPWILLWNLWGMPLS